MELDLQIIKKTDKVNVLQPMTKTHKKTACVKGDILFKCSLSGIKPLDLSFPLLSD